MKLQKRLAAEALNCTPSRVRFAQDSLDEIKEAITKFDIRRAIKQGAITKVPARGTSRVRARKNQEQRRKGRRKGHGSRKGKASARADPKTTWMSLVRSQRTLLVKLKAKGLLETSTFRTLYRKVHGGFFRSAHHIKMYVKEKGLLKHGNK